VKKKGYPVGEPGVNINLCDPADNECCVVRIESSVKTGLRIIAYQNGTEMEVVNYRFKAK
jgi:hypothetical protein